MVAEIGQDVDHDIEPLPRRIAADRGGPDRHRDEARRLFLVEQGLAFGLKLGIVGERLEGQILGHLDTFLDAVDGGRRRVDEALDADALGGAHQGHEGIEVDGPSEFGVELEGGIVRDAGKVNDGIAALERLLDHLAVANVALDLAQPGVAAAFLQDIFAVHVEIEDGHLVSRVEELRNQHRADIAGATGHQNTIQPGIFLVSNHGYVSSQLYARDGATALSPFHAVIEDCMAKRKVADLDVTVGGRIEVEIHVAGLAQGVVRLEAAQRQHRAAQLARSRHRSKDVRRLSR